MGPNREKLRDRYHERAEGDSRGMGGAMLGAMRSQYSHSTDRWRESSLVPSRSCMATA